MPIQIEIPERVDVVALLQEHLQDMAAHSPPESVHALDLPALQSSNITFVTARTETGQLQGCAALKTLSAEHGELKSMRTATQYLRRGIAAQLLRYIIELAHARNIGRISLETGTPEAFLPARELYSRFGFVTCPPFGDYPADPYSVCMTLVLSGKSRNTTR